MHKVISVLFIIMIYFFSSIFCLEVAGKKHTVLANARPVDPNAHYLSDTLSADTLSTDTLPTGTIQERKPNGEEKDLLIVSEKNGDTVTCSFQNDKLNNFNCKQYNKNDYPGLSTSFIKKYSTSNKGAIQYGYFLSHPGSLLTECRLCVKDIDDSPYIKNCQTRKDIKLPVRIISGKVLSSINKLLLIDENAGIYQCNYNAENKISGCYPTEIKKISATDAEFNPAYNKVYLYSSNTNEMNSCDATDDNVCIKNCLPVNLNTGFPVANIRQVISVPGGNHVLLAEKSTLHYCDINNQTMELDNCITVYDKFYNIASLVYSKNNDNLLYVLDNNMIKACYFDDTEVHCDKLKVNNNIKLISANKLSSARVTAFSSVKVTNKGGYKLSVSYTDNKDSDIGKNIRDSKNLFINGSEKLEAKNGSGIELHAIDGNTKCFRVNKPGEIHCSRGTLNMACYYNGSSKNIINGPCPFDLYKNLCTPEVFAYAKNLSGEAKQHCHYWKMYHKKNHITIRCGYESIWGHIYHDNNLSCYSVWKAMKGNSKFSYQKNGGWLVITW